MGIVLFNFERLGFSNINSLPAFEDLVQSIKSKYQLKSSIEQEEKDNSEAGFFNM